MENAHENKVDPKALEATCGNTNANDFAEPREIKPVEVYNPQERRTTYTSIALKLIGGGLLLGAATVYILHTLQENEKDYQRQLKELRTIPVIEYVVQKGECLGTIAQRFTHGLDIDKVVDKTCELNPEINRETKIVKTGQTIRVPYNIVDNKERK